MNCGGVPGSAFNMMKYEEFEEQRANVCNSEGKLTNNIPSTLNLNTKSNHFVLDLNSQTISNSTNHDPFHPYKNQERVHPRDTLSECGSMCGSQEEKDSMKAWNEMRQNGFLSSSHPTMPRPCGRKKVNESVIKKKIEIAKKEQVDRFAKVAAPSGLLNKLNPGIINHVRNSRQVCSIIENLVRSARSKHNNGGSKQDDSSFNCYDDLKCKNSYGECEDDALALKLSSDSTMVSENMSSLTNEESMNISTVDSLSVKAASVASQWLELLHRDIKGRLAALKRSRKRVRFVTQTELPFLISMELSSNQENDPCVVRSFENGGSNKANDEMHKFRWNALFNQMDKSLSEEEKHLENSLNQVREMLLHCEHGLLQFHPANRLRQQTTLQNDYIFSKVEAGPDKDLAVQAAGAAIYSTSNFLRSVEIIH